jgi:hypothetical protein
MCDADRGTRGAAACRDYWLETAGFRQPAPHAYVVGSNKPSNLHARATGVLRIGALFPSAPASRFVVMMREPAKRSWSSINFHTKYYDHARWIVDRHNVTQLGKTWDCAAPANAPACAFSVWTSSLVAWRRVLEACYVQQTGAESYGAAIEAASLERLAELEAGACAHTHVHPVLGHLDISIYVDALRILAKRFPRPQTFVASLEAFAADRVGVHAKLVRFLGLQLYGAEQGYASEAALRDTLAVRYNSGNYRLPAPTPAEMATLRRFFAPYNAELVAWLRETDDGANTAFDAEQWEA